MGAFVGALVGTFVGAFVGFLVGDLVAGSPASNCGLIEIDDALESVNGKEV